MKGYLPILIVLLMFGCKGQPMKQIASTPIIIDSVIKSKIVSSPDSLAVLSVNKLVADLWNPVLWDGHDGDYYIDSLQMDWAQVLEHYRQICHPKVQHLILSLNEHDAVVFDITQPPRLDDIHYIDTMLTICYGCSTWVSSAAFNRELEKYLSLPITFKKTLPMFENSQGNDSEGGLFDKSSNGIYVSFTPDKKYKIYSFDDNTGGVGRRYCSYIQYLKNGKAKWQKLPNEFPQIHKIYSFAHKDKIYYAILGFARYYTPGWAEFFAVITIDNGKLIPHIECYPKGIQNNIYTIFDREKRKKELIRAIADGNNIEEKDVSRDVIEECLDEEEYNPLEKIKSEWPPYYNKTGYEYPNMIEFYNLGTRLDINVDFDPKTLTVSYNDLVSDGGANFEIKGRKSFRLNL